MMKRPLIVLLLTVLAVLLIAADADAQRGGRRPRPTSAPPSATSSPCGTWGCFEVGFPFIEGSTKGISIGDWVASRGGLVNSSGGAVGVIVNQLIIAVTVLAVMTALVSIVIGGYIYMTAGGSADRVRTAKYWIGAAIVGMSLAVLAWLILYAVNPSLT